jgi:orotidine-5'-phosphate decarboxylase
MPANPICVALDTPDLGRAVTLAKALKPHAGCMKVGMEFFYAHGIAGYAKVAEQGLPIFLDLKLHDIPNTVGMAMKSLMRLEPKPAIVNVHATGGLDMMKAAADAVAGQSKLIAVTILTSLSDDDIWAAGFETAKDTQAHARSLADLAKRAGLDGVVCSPHELVGIRHDLGRDFLTVVPGIRPADAATQDQKRVATPASAIAAGADILVIGRAITGASDPAKAARDILEGLA